MPYYGYRGDRFKASPEMKANMGKAAKETAKKVRCVETGAVYNSAVEAHTATGVHPSAISKICRGLMSNCKGLRFEFVN